MFHSVCISLVPTCSVLSQQVKRRGTDACSLQRVEATALLRNAAFPSALWGSGRRVSTWACQCYYRVNKPKITLASAVLLAGFTRSNLIAALVMIPISFSSPRVQWVQYHLLLLHSPDLSTEIEIQCISKRWTQFQSQGSREALTHLF